MLRGQWHIYHLTQALRQYTVCLGQDKLEECTIGHVGIHHFTAINIINSGNQFTKS